MKPIVYAAYSRFPTITHTHKGYKFEKLKEQQDIK
jgi:hypothetical protein